MASAISLFCLFITEGKKGGMIVFPYPDRCTGCRFCEIVCSLYHYNKVSPEFSAVRVSTEGIGTYIPSLCMHINSCGNERCIDVCIYNAIELKSGIVKINEELCTGCGACIRACRWSGIHLISIEGKWKVVKCDLCNGKPQCVIHCSQGALRFEIAENFESLYEKMKLCPL